jgi:hypothetical protein
VSLTPSEFEDAYLVTGDAPKGSGCNSRWSLEPELELEWRSATGRLNELAAIGVQRLD